ncbi:MAG: SpoIIE family protein phosphatase [Terriglobia bacterium]
MCANGNCIGLQKIGTATNCSGFDHREIGSCPSFAGDVLVLYTDGVVEVPDPSGKEFGLKGLERTIRGAWKLPASDMIQSVVRCTGFLIGSAGYNDDFTLMVVKRLEK